MPITTTQDRHARQYAALRHAAAVVQREPCKITLVTRRLLELRAAREQWAGQ